MCLPMASTTYASYLLAILIAEPVASPLRIDGEHWVRGAGGSGYRLVLYTDSTAFGLVT